MCDIIPDNIYVRHCLLYEYYQGSNATKAAKEICAMYPKGISLSKCYE